MIFHVWFSARQMRRRHSEIDQSHQFRQTTRHSSAESFRATHGQVQIHHHAINDFTCFFVDFSRNLTAKSLAEMIIGRHYQLLFPKF